MITQEIIQSRIEFEDEQHLAQTEAYEKLSKIDDYSGCYARLISFQAWSSYLLANIFPQGVLAFVTEAQNDGLISYLLARQGMWRPSLQSLRSCVENILVAHYYVDHPVEFQLWELGKHRIGFSELQLYFEAHPLFRVVKTQNLTGLSQLKSEYSDLSMAVHGSSKSFQMGDEENMPNVFIGNEKDFGQWACRQKLTLEALNLFLVAFHRAHITGPGYPQLRKALAYAISSSNGAKIKSEFKVTIKTSKGL